VLVEREALLRCRRRTGRTRQAHDAYSSPMSCRHTTLGGAAGGARSPWRAARTARPVRRPRQLVRRGGAEDPAADHSDLGPVGPHRRTRRLEKDSIAWAQASTSCSREPRPRCLPHLVQVVVVGVGRREVAVVGPFARLTTTTAWAGNRLVALSADASRPRRDALREPRRPAARPSPRGRDWGPAANELIRAERRSRSAAAPGGSDRSAADLTSPRAWLTASCSVSVTASIVVSDRRQRCQSPDAQGSAGLDRRRSLSCAPGGSMRPGSTARHDRAEPRWPKLRQGRRRTGGEAPAHPTRPAGTASGDPVVDSTS
jgi:hypothetical protein